MSVSTSSTNFFSAVKRGVALYFVVASGLLTAFISQASSPDYSALFRSMMPLAAIHFVAVAIYFLRVDRWHRWLALAIGALAGVGVTELALRVL